MACDEHTTSVFLQLVDKKSMGPAKQQDNTAEHYYGLTQPTAKGALRLHARALRALRAHISSLPDQHVAVVRFRCRLLRMSRIQGIRLCSSM